MNTPDQKYDEYLIRAKRGDVRICGTSPFKVMNKRNDRIEAVKMEGQRDEVQTFESDDLNLNEETVRNENVEMEIENASLKAANRRLKNQILRMHRRHARAASSSAVDAGAAVTVVDKIGYSCEICGRQFTFKSAMTRHVNAVHLKKKPHKCNNCAYSNYQLTNVRTHMMLKHGVFLKPINKG